MERPFYGSFGWAYDELIADPVAPWVEAVESVLPRGGATVLDAGCGTGRHAAELARRGHRLVLVDRAGPLLEQAQRRVPTAVAIRADLTALELDMAVDAVSCRGVLNDLVEDADRDAAVHSFARVLRHNGAAVIEVRDREATRARYAEPREVRRTVETAHGPLTYVSTARFDEDRLQVHERHEHGQEAATHEFVMRPWTEEELRERFSAAGFTELRIAPGPGRPTGDRILCTARRA